MLRGAGCVQPRAVLVGRVRSALGSRGFRGRGLGEHPPPAHCSFSPFSRMLPIALEVLGSLLAWLCLYAAFCLWNRHRSPEWNCRLVTLLHGATATCLSGYIALWDGPWPLSHAGACGASPCHILTSSHGWGSDCFCCLSSHVCVLGAWQGSIQLPASSSASPTSCCPTQALAEGSQVEFHRAAAVRCGIVENRLDAVCIWKGIITAGTRAWASVCAFLSLNLK